MRPLIICDIDGVIADCTHRLHYLKDNDYDSFYGIKMLDDRVIKNGKKLVFSLESSLDYSRLWMLTGRPERTRRLTELWLRQEAERWPSEILMRPDGDYRPSPEIKVKLLKAVKKELKEFDPIYFIDDDPENVKAVEKAFPNITGIVFTTKRF